MTTTSTNLSLTLFNSTTDQSGSFLTWLNAVSGSNNSNMIKIDNWSGSASGSISSLRTSMSGSITTLTASMNSISGSIATLNTNISALQLRLAKLGTFNTTGTADITVASTYKHLLIVGVASGTASPAANEMNIGIDFNGDANSSKYYSLQWYRTNLIEAFAPYEYGCILVGAMNGNGTSFPTYGTPFMVWIPNYSATSGYYKTAVALSTFYGPASYVGAMQGGYWRDTSAITRIRIFGVRGSSYRYGFGTGTKIDVYGWG